MGQIEDRIPFPEPESEYHRKLEVGVIKFSNDLADIINNGLTFQDNWRGEIKTIADTGVANSENTVAHTLKRVPTGYILLKSTVSTTVYDGSAATATNIYLKFSGANCNVKILVF